VATPQSLRRIARLTEKLYEDLRKGGMAYPWKSLFRTNATLVRVVALLAEHLAQEAQERGSRPQPVKPRRGKIFADADTNP
jgi:hypothetical protein